LVAATTIQVHQSQAFRRRRALRARQPSLQDGKVLDGLLPKDPCWCMPKVPIAELIRSTAVPGGAEDGTGSDAWSASRSDGSSPASEEE